MIHPNIFTRPLPLILLFLVMLFSSCVRRPVIDLDESITCDMELLSGDSTYIRSSSHPEEIFEGADKLIDTVARSGKYSMYIKKGRQFGLKYRLKNTSPGQYFEISVWRKGEGNAGYLVISDDVSKKFYQLNNNADSIDPRGWERISYYFYVPPHIQDEDILIYLWNPKDVDVFFDDLTISRKKNQQYPIYRGIPSIDIFLDTTQVLKLTRKRDDAFRKGILETEDNDWVDGVLFIDEEMYHGELRLKGDWLDHLLGLKWSFRIKLAKESTWNGMRTFSVQNPVTRDFINEWLLHSFCRSEDILAPRYGFIPLNFNGKSRGLYAYEEHFEKHLVEYNYRREGPILKLNEDHFWKAGLISRSEKTDMSLPIVKSAELMPFKLSRTLKDTTLLNQFVIGQDLYYQYLKGKKQASEIFDIEKLAKYLAMLDLHRTYHGIIWHNQRFYYNPVISKLEPIVFDNFTETGHVKYFKSYISGHSLISLQETKSTEFMWSTIFTDSSFVEHYIKYLRKYSQPDFIKTKLHEEASMIAYYDSLIKIEFPQYSFDHEVLFINAERIRKELPAFEKAISDFLRENKVPVLSEPAYTEDYSNKLAESFIKAYTEYTSDTGSFIRVENYFCKDILILGTSRGAKGMTNNIYPEISLGKMQASCGTDTAFMSPERSKFLYFMIEGDKNTYSVPIMSWRKPGHETPLQQLTATYAENYLKYFSHHPVSNTLTLNAGHHQINEPLIVPKGFKEVVFPAGSKVDIINSAPFISYSSIKILGTEEDPVLIKSSDGTASGFTVLQASGLSVVKHAIFDHLNTMDINGWLLTGAVTFYESDVHFYNTSFENNLCEDGLNIIRSEFIMDNCMLLNTFGDALDVDFGNGKIQACTFKYLNNDAIDVSGSDVVVSNCLIESSNDKGISGGENSQLLIMDTRINQSVIGIASKDKSKLQIQNCEISDSRYGLVVFQKKPEFGPASIQAHGISLSGVSTPYLIEIGSECIIDNVTIPDDQDGVAGLFY